MTKANYKYGKKSPQEIELFSLQVEMEHKEHGLWSEANLSNLGNIFHMGNEKFHKQKAKTSDDNWILIDNIFSQK